jgi:SNF2 family DNA or RNA helicase
MAGWKYPYKTKPYEHQRKALKESAERTTYALFMEMGTGKTKTTIDNIAYLYLKKRIDSALIVAPKSVYTVWKNEINTHLPDQIERIAYAWKVDKPKQLQPFITKKGLLKFFLINVEALSTKKGLEICNKYLLNQPNNIMVIDESTTIKNPKAKRTKNILALRWRAKMRRILTGSPVTKSPLDLYSQCAFLDPALLGFKSYYAFRNRYCTFDEVYIARGEAIMVPDGYTNLDELEQKLKNFSIRLTKDECLDIPEKIYQKREVIISGDQKRIYDRLRIEALAKFENETISVHNQLTELLRLHQVANGYCKSDDGEILQFNNEKLKALLEILEETDQKVIIWATYVHNINEIIASLNDKYGSETVVSIYGETSQSDRMLAVDRFQNDDKCRFFVGNPTTGGYGLTLTAAKYVIYYSNNYNLEVRKQSEDRAHRIGQTKNVVYIDIMAKDTIDEKIVKALKRKNQLSAKTLGDKAKDWLL